MFKDAVKESLKRKRRAYQWLSDGTEIPIYSITSFLSAGRGLSMERIERIFEFLGIKLKLPEE